MDGFAFFYTLGVLFMLIDIHLPRTDQYKEFFPFFNIAFIILAVVCAFVNYVGSP